MLFTGSKPRAPKKRNPPVSHRNDDTEEEIVSPRTTKRQRAAVAKKRSSAGPIKLMNEFSKEQFLEIRNVNPYVVEKNVRLCPNPYFYQKNQ
jgi:hypothetical protein